MSSFAVEKIHPAFIDNNKVNKYVYKIREKYVGGSSNNIFSRLKLHNAEESNEQIIPQESAIESTNNENSANNKVDNKNDNGSRFYYLSALTSLGIQFGTIIYWYFSS